VPAELLSGHHAQIERWRRAQRLVLTARARLIDRRAPPLSRQDEQVLKDAASEL
jgi:tRNA (guanine37-N1)-methyltransferase